MDCVVRSLETLWAGAADHERRRRGRRVELGQMGGARGAGVGAWRLKGLGPHPGLLNRTRRILNLLDR